MTGPKLVPPASPITNPAPSLPRARSGYDPLTGVWDLGPVDERPGWLRRRVRWSRLWHWRCRPARVGRISATFTVSRCRCGRARVTGFPGWSW